MTPAIPLDDDDLPDLSGEVDDDWLDAWDDDDWDDEEDWDEEEEEEEEEEDDFCSTLVASEADDTDEVDPYEGAEFDFSEPLEQATWDDLALDDIPF